MWFTSGLHYPVYVADATVSWFRLAVVSPHPTLAAADRFNRSYSLFFGVAGDDHRGCSPNADRISFALVSKGLKCCSTLFRS
jgi:hypothetical protein